MHSAYNRGCTGTGNFIFLHFCKSVAGLSPKQNGGKDIAKSGCWITIHSAIHNENSGSWNNFLQLYEHPCSAYKVLQTHSSLSHWLQADPAKRHGCDACHATFCSCLASCRFVCVDVATGRETASNMPRYSDAMSVVARQIHPHDNGPIPRSFAHLFVLETPGSTLT